MSSLRFPTGVKARIFGSDSSFLNAIRFHPRFQNRTNLETGISLTDCDMIICNYKHESSRSVMCVQFIEVKSRNAEPDFAQTEVYKAIHSFKGNKNGLIFYGVSFVSYSGEALESSSSFRWGRFNNGVIAWRNVEREEMFDLVTMLRHPDTLTKRKLFHSHHGCRVVAMEVDTALGFKTPSIIKKQY